MSKRALRQSIKNSRHNKRQAAEQGDAEAQSRLGYYYLHGIGTPKDETEVVSAKDKAEVQKVSDQSYFGSTGVPEYKAEEVKDVKTFQQAVMRDNAEVKKVLGWSPFNSKQPEKKQPKTQKADIYDIRQTPNLFDRLSSPSVVPPK